MEKPDRNNPFPPTRWTLIAKAGAAADDGQRKDALEELCQIYWPPIFTFVRSKGATVEEAEDLTQGFFADFLKRENFQKPKQELGKLRTYLLKSVSHYMTNDWRDRNRLKRGGGITIVSMDVEINESGGNSGGLLVPCPNLTPEALFDQQWAITLLAEVLNELKKRYVARKQELLFEKLKHSIQLKGVTIDYRKIAGELKMTESALKVAVHRMRKRYAALLRETISDTLTEGEDVEEEMRALMTTFAR